MLHLSRAEPDAPPDLPKEALSALKRVKPDLMHVPAQLPDGAERFHEGIKRRRERAISTHAAQQVIEQFFFRLGELRLDVLNHTRIKILAGEAVTGVQLGQVLNIRR